MAPPPEAPIGRERGTAANGSFGGGAAGMWCRPLLGVAWGQGRQAKCCCHPGATQDLPSLVRADPKAMAEPPTQSPQAPTAPTANTLAPLSQTERLVAFSKDCIPG
ncbi:unnamed protein product [Natator depressus]